MFKTLCSHCFFKILGHEIQYKVNLDQEVVFVMRIYIYILYTELFIFIFLKIILIMTCQFIFSIKIIYLGVLAGKFGHPPNMDMYNFMSFVIQFLTCSTMVASIFDDLVKKKVGYPLILQPMRDCRNRQSWPLVSMWCKHTLR